MKYKNIIGTVSEELSLPEELVSKVYKAYWRFIRDTIEQLPLKRNLSQEEFNSLRTNINIPSLGKLSCTYNRYVGVKNRFNTIKQLRDRNEN